MPDTNVTIKPTMSFEPPAPSLIVDETVAVFQDSTITYNEAGYTYNEVGGVYGGSDRRQGLKPQTLEIKNNPTT